MVLNVQRETIRLIRNGEKWGGGGGGGYGGAVSLMSSTIGFSVLLQATHCALALST